MAGKKREDRAFDKRFWSKVEKGDEHWHCWEWTGGTIHGHGQTGIANKKLYAHRAAYRLAGKYPIEPEQVMHVCDNRRCVNPLHLVGGNALLNLQDAARKGRLFNRRQSDKPHSKLTAEQVRAIRSDRRLQREIAEEYGVTQANISEIKRRRTWKNLKQTED